MLKWLGNIIRVKILNIAGDEVNPASDTKLDELKIELTNIFHAVDELEFINENIKIEAQQINLNTDELEAKTQSIRDQLDVLSSTRASEATAQSILDSLGVGSGTSILNELESLNSIVATEATLQQIVGYLDTVETKLQTIIDHLFNIESNTDKLDVNLSTRASEVTVNSILGQLDITLSALRDALKGSENKDFTTLEADIESILAQLDVALSTRASEETLIQIRDYVDTLEAKIQLIIDKLDVNLSTRASESTLILVKSNLDDLKIQLDTLIAKDFATETTLVEIKDTIGQESGSTVLTKLQDIWDKLVELFETGIGKFKLWDGTYQAKIDEVGRVLVSSQIIAPPNTTDVHKVYYNSVATVSDNFFTIPSGEKLRIKKLTVSSEIDSNAGNVIELYYAPNGDTTNLTIITVIFTSGNSNQHFLDEEYIGNGTIAILLRRRRLSGGSKEIFALWEGYY